MRTPRLYLMFLLLIVSLVGYSSQVVPGIRTSAYLCGISLSAETDAVDEYHAELPQVICDDLSEEDQGNEHHFDLVATFPCYSIHAPDITIKGNTESRHMYAGFTGTVHVSFSILYSVWRL